MQNAVEIYGRLDCCCNCAGIECEKARVHEVNEQTFDDVMKTNAKGVWICMKYEIEQFSRQVPRSVTCSAVQEVVSVRGSIVTGSRARPGHHHIPDASSQLSVFERSP